MRREKVVQRVRRIVDVDEKGLFVRGAGQHRRVFAQRRVRGVEGRKLRAERSAAIGNECDCRRIVEVRYVALVNVPRFKGDVPIIVEFVIIGQADPLQVVVAPNAIVPCIHDGVEAILPVVAGPAHADRARRHCPRIP